MAKLTDLPAEILRTIVQHLDTLYEHGFDLTIFDVMRINRQFMSVAIDVHFNLVRPSIQPTSDLYQVESSSKWSDEKWKEMITKMAAHERCYLNYQKSHGRGPLGMSSRRRKAEADSGSQANESKKKRRRLRGKSKRR